jgi:hypothetical protein
LHNKPIVRELSAEELEQLHQPSMLKEAVSLCAAEIDRQEWRGWVEHEIQTGRLPPSLRNALEGVSD